MFFSDADSERASSIADYQTTCADFITDISKDYGDWVDRYDLDTAENKNRKTTIESIRLTTNKWIRSYGNTIKKIDIIMNDGINKMAESTAGYPFKIEIRVNDMVGYTHYPTGEIKVNVRAIPRPGRIARIGDYQKGQIFLINSVDPVEFTVSPETRSGGDILDDYVLLNAKSCHTGDLISITIIIEEADATHLMDRRGSTTLILLS
ncbi:MAG TPA: hypothetical protein VH796_13735 [Nitrososphaeraceae archaeon]